MITLHPQNHIATHWWLIIIFWYDMIQSKQIEHEVHAVFMINSMFDSANNHEWKYLHWIFVRNSIFAAMDGHIKWLGFVVQCQGIHGMSYQFAKYCNLHTTESSAKEKLSEYC